MATPSCVAERGCPELNMARVYSLDLFIHAKLTACGYLEGENRGNPFLSPRTPRESVLLTG